MRSVRSTVNVGSSPTVGAVFSAMKAEYVVVAEQAHPLGPAYSITNISILPLISYRLVSITTAYSIGFEP